MHSLGIFSLNKAVYGAPKIDERKTGHTVLNMAANQSGGTSCETCQTSQKSYDGAYNYDRQGRTAFRQYPIAPFVPLGGTHQTATTLLHYCVEAWCRRTPRIRICRGRS